MSLCQSALYQTAAQYADGDETRQLTEDEASEPHVTIIIRDYLIPLFSFAVEWSWADWILIGSHSERQSRSVDADLTVLPLLRLLDLAVIMHAMWVDGTFYCGDPDASQADLRARAAAKERKLLGAHA